MQYLHGVISRYFYFIYVYRIKVAHAKIHPLNKKKEEREIERVKDEIE